MTITRLSGGLTPGDGADPRTFPAIWNDTADAIDSLAIGTAVATDGQVLTYSTAVAGYVPEDAQGVPDNAYVYVDTVYFTSNDTFTKASYPWLRAIRVKVQGGGGAGGGAQITTATQVSVGGGGGGGEYREAFITDIASLGTAVTVTVGAGGSGSAGANGGNGGTSVFGSIEADGGDGGDVSVAANPPQVATGRLGGSGGSGSADLSIDGQRGSSGFGMASSLVVSGHGGSSQLGFAGASFAFTTFSTGNSAVDFGSGGGGGLTGNSQATARSGGSGSNGIVIVELYA